MRKKETISKILTLKDNKKKEVELEVKKAYDKLDEEKTKLVNLEKEYNSKLQLFNQKSAEGLLTVNNISSYYDFFARITGSINEQRQIHVRCRNELELIKNNLVNAHKDKKIFEILHEKVVKQDLKEKQVNAQKESDYLVLARKMR